MAIIGRCQSMTQEILVVGEKEKILPETGFVQLVETDWASASRSAVLQLHVANSTSESAIGASSFMF